MQIYNSIITALPTKIMVRNGNFGLRKLYLKENSDITSDYYDSLFGNYNNGTYSLDEYDKIRNNLSKINKLELIKCKDEIINVLNLDRENLLKILDNVKNIDTINLSYSDNDVSTISELIRYCINYMRSEAINVYKIETERVNDVEKIKKICNDIIDNSYFYATYIKKCFINNFGGLLCIDELFEFLNSIFDISEEVIKEESIRFTSKFISAGKREEKEQSYFLDKKLKFR